MISAKPLLMLRPGGGSRGSASSAWSGAAAASHLLAEIMGRRPTLLSLHSLVYKMLKMMHMEELFQSYED